MERMTFSSPALGVSIFKHLEIFIAGILLSIQRSGCTGRLEILQSRSQLRMNKIMNNGLL